MFVKSLDLNNFRNYESLGLAFSEGVNVFYGSNAQGKTNILEALYLSCTTKSHRLSKDRDMIRIGQDEGHIRTVLVRRGTEYRIDMHLRRHKSKGVAVNGVPVKKASELYRIAGVVFFSPEDLMIIKSGPSGRRRFTDMVLSSTDRLYLSELSDYTKCLAQRNALLHDAENGKFRISELDVWDEQLVSCGTKIIRKRREFFDDFEKTASRCHSLLTGGKEELKMIYEPNIEEELFADRLASGREYDLRTKMTNSGPHRDDFVVRANGMDLRYFGSQGQIRTAALSMKMAEIETLEQVRGERPVLLLDDVLSELDSGRRHALLQLIRGTQTFITCTGLDEFAGNHFEADRIFQVQGGKVKPH